MYNYNYNILIWMVLDSQKSLILLAKVANLEFWGAIPQGLVDLKLSHCGHYPMKEPLNQLPRCWSDASRWLVPLNNSMALYSCVGITQPITQSQPKQPAWSAATMSSSAATCHICHWLHQWKTGQGSPAGWAIGLQFTHLCTGWETCIAYIVSIQR